MTVLTGVSFGYDVTAQGFYAQTEIAPAASFVSVQGNPLTIYFSGIVPDNISQMQKISFLGGIGQQSFGYTKYFTVDTTVAFGLSLGGASGASVYNYIPVSSSFFDATGECYFSVPVTQGETVFIEPMLGFGYLWLSTEQMLNGSSYARMNDIAELSAYGPMGGLFARIFLAEGFSLRFGSAYQITQMQAEAYDSLGILAGDAGFRARRHGILGRLRLDYKASDFVAFMMGFEVQSWSSSGTTVNQDGAMSMRIARTRISWGVNFKY